MTYPPNNDPYQNQQPPQYGAPQPPPQYGAPQPPQQYGTPQPQQYGTPQPQQYGQQYGAPQPQYGAPGGYGAPAVNYASWAQRLGGYLIDGLVLLPFYIVAIVVGQKSSAFLFIFLLLGVAASGYNRWYLGGQTGQSWGRKALGIRLVSEETGQPIGAAMAFVRDLTHALDTLACYVGWLFPLWDPKKQTFADKIIKTLVVQ